jgi:hypothetical protein
MWESGFVDDLRNPHQGPGDSTSGSAEFPGIKILREKIHHFLEPQRSSQGTVMRRAPLLAGGSPPRWSARAPRRSTRAGRGTGACTRRRAQHTSPLVPRNEARQSRAQRQTPDPFATPLLFPICTHDHRGPRADIRLAVVEEAPLIRQSPTRIHIHFSCGTAQSEEAQKIGLDQDLRTPGEQLRILGAAIQFGVLLVPMTPLPCAGRSCGGEAARPEGGQESPIIVAR